jgi:hypothetical protein
MQSGKCPCIFHDIRQQEKGLIIGVACMKKNEK